MLHAHTHDRHGHGGLPAVERAERFSQARGMSFTPMRRRVLDALVAAAKPVTAYDLAEQLSTDRRVAPVQVYRVLDFLMEAGVVHRLATQSAFVVCDHEHVRGETIVFLICSGCGNVAEVTSPGVGRGLAGAADSTDFEVIHPVVEVQGRCSKCRA